MSVSTPEAVRETLHTAFFYKQPQYRVLFDGSDTDFILVQRYIRTLVDVPQSAPPLEFVSHAYYMLQAHIDTTNRIITLDIVYQPVTDNTRYVADQERSIVDELIRPGMSEAEKVRAIHDWVVLHLKYDDTYQRFYQYEALRDRTVVCNGYALLTYDLLELAGVRAYVITGLVHESQAPGKPLKERGHAWNIVRVDGIWYHLDTTWDDPTPDRPGEIQYTFYLVDVAQIAESRAIQQSTTESLKPQTTEGYQNS